MWLIRNRLYFIQQKPPKNEQEVDSDINGNIQSQDGQKLFCLSVPQEQQIEDVREPLQIIATAVIEFA